MSLILQVSLNEYFDERSGKIIRDTRDILVEHSLLSISKWESIWKKPFLKHTEERLSKEELLSYIACMCVNTDDENILLKHLSEDILMAIVEYIGDSRSATTIKMANTKGSSTEVVTTELIYYWMSVIGLPFECEKWNFNRLMNTIQIAAIKSAPAKKMSKKETADYNRKLNEQRKRELGSKG